MSRHADKFTPGHKINKLTFVDHGTPRERTGGRKRAFVLLRCDCGNLVERDRYAWLSGRQQSCGCVGAATRHLRHQTHGQSGTPLYKAWLSMKARSTPGRVAHSGCYANVGRDQRWDTFEGFVANQPNGRPFRDGLQLARNGDVGDYTPENCRWVTPAENVEEMYAKRLVRLSDGRAACDVAAENGIAASTWQNRYYSLGWSLERSVSTPVGAKAN